MYIGRVRCREHPNQHLCTTTKKKVREESREKNTGKNVRENTEKSKGKSHVTSGDVTSGQACAMVRSSRSST
jgi:hypothetical protein